MRKCAIRWMHKDGAEVEAEMLVANAAKMHYQLNVIAYFIPLKWCE